MVIGICLYLVSWLLVIKIPPPLPRFFCFLGRFFGDRPAGAHAIACERQPQAIAWAPNGW
ncbi:MAG: hypothetical protein A2445_00390 [Candidatus Jacksonbacteria bacterium RIFOXYC2_FULL_44_29]|nr:MAG: hypothetical protein A2445_00390 [Candidatus Jacksonbacteria bacterium RIFOXYC2_FULL_44_29]HBH46714.1 hypothetical protein [Candidatus Jacksonbacteria bacterium]